MERTIKKVKDSPLVGLWFIELRLKGNRQEYVRCGKIVSMVKDNYWYLISLYDVKTIYNLSEMHNWKFYNNYQTYGKEVREWRK